MRQPISKAAILRNWKIASDQRRDEIELIYYRDDIFNNEQGMEELLNTLPFEMIVPKTNSPT